MNWKETLNILEQNEDFDVAIFFMQNVIRENPDDVDAYIFMLFRLMDTIVEHSCYFANISRTAVRDIKKEYYDAKEDEYSLLAPRYFQEGYAKFSDNAEFLYYVGDTACMSYWYFTRNEELIDSMLPKASLLDPKNPVYQWPYYAAIQRKNDKDEGLLKYIEKVLEDDSQIQKTLQTKGALGKGMLSRMRYWAKEIIANNERR